MAALTKSRRVRARSRSVRRSRRGYFCHHSASTFQERVPGGERVDLAFTIPENVTDKAHVEVIHAMRRLAQFTRRRPRTILS